MIIRRYSLFILETESYSGFVRAWYFFNMSGHELWNDGLSEKMESGKIIVIIVKLKEDKLIELRIIQTINICNKGRTCLRLSPSHKSYS